MSYIEDNLNPNETIIYRARLHWGMFLSPFGVVGVGVIGSVAGFGLPGQAQGTGGGCLCISGLIALLGVLMLIGAAVSYSSSEFAVTDQRVIGKTGFIRRDMLDLLLTKVESVTVNEPILGRVLGYGTVTIIGSGGTRTPFRGVAEPMKFRQRIQGGIGGD